MKSLTKISPEQAQKQIEHLVRKTPVEPFKYLSKQLGQEVFLKMENWQITGSFKVRGAINHLLSLDKDEKERGIITASAGNHALGVAYAAELFKIDAKIVLPANASPAKIKKLGLYPCTVIQAGKDYDEAELLAHQIKKDYNLTFVHAFDDPQVIAGQSTIALELAKDLPEADAVLVPIGGGGLISGIAYAIKNYLPKTKVIGIQLANNPAMINALKSGHVVETAIGETIADGLAGRFVSDLTLQLVKEYVDEIVTVEEDDIYQAIQLLMQEKHILIEGSAAVGIAALLAGKISNSYNKVVSILTGRNINTDLVKKILAKV